MRPVFRDLAVGGLVQFLSLLFAASILDQGGWYAATERISAGFWCGVILVLARRHTAMTKGDRQFLRYGLLPLLVIGLPITLGIWTYRRVI